MSIEILSVFVQLEALHIVSYWQLVVVQRSIKFNGCKRSRLDVFWGVISILRISLSTRFSCSSVLI
jgi:hypothetical protein